VTTLSRTSTGQFGAAALAIALGFLDVLRGPPSALGAPATARPTPSRLRGFLEEHCLDCHDGPDAKGKLDLARLPLALDQAKSFATWVKVHDRVAAGEMPPGKRDRPPRAEVVAFLGALGEPLVAADQAREAAEGRSTRRRMNRYELENTLRELFGAPWLQVKDILPEDGEAHRFNKAGEALDVSHVQIAQILSAAEYAMDEVLAARPPGAAPRTERFYARDMPSFTGHFTRQGAGHVRGSFPVLGNDPQPDVRARKAPVTAGPTDPATREREGVGFVHGTYEPVEPRFDRFRAPQPGRYRIRLHANSIWVGAQAAQMWWAPDFDNLSRGHRAEPITVYAERPPTLLRRLGAFDAGPDPTTVTFDVVLLQGETIRPDASRFFRSRPARTEGRPLGSAFRNPLATREGQPGVVYRWLEVEGPLPEDSGAAGRALLFDDLPIEELGQGRIQVTPRDARADATRLVRAFLGRAYRRPVQDAEVDRFAGGVRAALDAGAPFAEALRSGYAAILASPGFIYFDEPEGALDGHALAARLAYFLWNGPPDEALRAAATRGELQDPRRLRSEAERLLGDPRARRFVDAFLDYWLDLRRLGATSPDAVLYPDYALDDMLLESAKEETQLFFAELLRRDLPVRHVVASDFAMVNERLAELYGLPAPLTSSLGVGLRRVALPRGHVRGGLLTQASVLKVTANGTSTSPMVRGAWISERLLGVEVPPPPAGVPAVEPDIRGAETIRQQLEKHRADKSCASCHVKIDPAGLALEAFDVFGGARTRYRAMGEGPTPTTAWGKDGIRHEFHAALPVDPSGTLASGERFSDVQELKRIILRDERALARNLARQLTVYATGSAVRFADRPRLEALLDRARHGGYGVRSLVLALVESDLFRHK
jgi:hypothetical protein